MLVGLYSYFRLHDNPGENGAELAIVAGWIAHTHLFAMH